MESKPCYPAHVQEIHAAINKVVDTEGRFKDYTHRIQPKSKSPCSRKLQEPLHIIEIYKGKLGKEFKKPAITVYVGKKSATEVPPDIRVWGDHQDNEFARCIGKEIVKMKPLVRWIR